MTQLNQPHDALARNFLTDIEIAKDFLRIHLKPSILAICDLNSINIESSSYIEDDLKAHCSDVLYRINLKHSDSEFIYVYTLVEHQSSAEELMPFRIIKYQIAIIQEHLDKYGKEKSIKLPLVVPIVFYNGRQSPYPYTSDITDLFADQERYMQVKLGKFDLVDLSIMRIEEILKHGKVGVLELFEKIIFIRDFVSVIDSVVGMLEIAEANGLSDRLGSSAFNLHNKTT